MHLITSIAIKPSHTVSRYSNRLILTSNPALI
ncbi:hypothetical protein EMIT043CA1_50224 [Pseudomonas brassicacearum]